METPTLLGPNVVLDALRADDASRMVDITDAEVDRWIRWHRIDRMTLAVAESDIQGSLHEWHGGLARKQWAIRMRDEPALIGRADVSETPGFQIRHLNIWLGPDHRRQGIASEAVELLLDYAFDVLGWGWVEAQIDAENEPSIRLAERLGAVPNGQGNRREDGRLIKIYRFVAGHWTRPTNVTSGSTY